MAEATLYSAVMAAASQCRVSVHQKESVVRGHHIYKSSWTPVLGEELLLKREEGNQHDEYAVAVLRNGAVVGHMPRCISRVSWFFLRRGGKISCKITGKRKLGVGLEVPCVYMYTGSARMARKLSRLLDEDTPPLSCPY